MENVSPERMLIIILLICFGLSFRSEAGFKASVGPEFVIEHSVQQRPYTITQDSVSEEGLITTQDTSSNDLVGRLNVGYDVMIYKTIGLDTTLSGNSKGTIRGEFLLLDKVTEKTVLKVGPSYSIETSESHDYLDKPFGFTAGVEIKIDKNLFLDFKGNLSFSKTNQQNSTEQRTTSTGSFFGGIGVRF